MQIDRGWRIGTECCWILFFLAEWQWTCWKVGAPGWRELQDFKIILTLITLSVEARVHLTVFSTSLCERLTLDWKAASLLNCNIGGETLWCGWLGRKLDCLRSGRYIFKHGGQIHTTLYIGLVEIPLGYGILWCQITAPRKNFPFSRKFPIYSIQLPSPQPPPPGPPRPPPQRCHQVSMLNLSLPHMVTGALKGHSFARCYITLLIL